MFFIKTKNTLSGASHAFGFCCSATADHILSTRLNNGVGCQTFDGCAKDREIFWEVGGLPPSALVRGFFQFNERYYYKLFLKKYNVKHNHWDCTDHHPVFPAILHKKSANYH